MWASGSCPEDRHNWWRDGRWKRTIGSSCPSKIQTGLGNRSSQKMLTDYNNKEANHSLDQTCRRWWWSSSTAPAMSPMAMEAEGRDFFSKQPRDCRTRMSILMIMLSSHSRFNISDEVNRYLADTDTMCNPVRMAAYLTIRQIFIDFNTGLPTSAAVERASSH